VRLCKYADSNERSGLSILVSVSLRAATRGMRFRRPDTTDRLRIFWMRDGPLDDDGVSSLSEDEIGVSVRSAKYPHRRRSRRKRHTGRSILKPHLLRRNNSQIFPRAWVRLVNRSGISNRGSGGDILSREKSYDTCKCEAASELRGVMPEPWLQSFRSGDGMI
jgi:hypothetical protein